MLTKTIKLICILITFNSINAHQSKAVELIDCDFTNPASLEWSEILCCSVNNNLSIKNEDTNISIMTPIPTECQGFSAIYKEIHYFPIGIEKFITNLKGLRITNSGLLEISSNNLEPFTNLTVLDLKRNKIEILERNLFKFNQKLKFVDLDENVIKIIDPTAFNGLNSLELPKFGEHQCNNGKINLNNLIMTSCWSKEMDAVKIYTEHIERSINRKMTKLISQLEEQIESTPQPEDLKDFLTFFNSIALIAVLVILVKFKLMSNNSSNYSQSFTIKPNDENSSKFDNSVATNVNKIQDDYEKVTNVNIYDDPSNYDDLCSSLEISHDTYSSAVDAINYEELKNENVYDKI
ncbi:hypothetical protein ACKWTF_014159 [Chironomus riparius]